MIRRMKKQSKKIAIFVLFLVMVMSYFWPFAKVIAETYGTGSYAIQLRLNSGNFTVHGVTINEEEWTSETDTYKKEDGIFTIVIDVEKNGDEYPSISHCGGECGSHYSTSASLSEAPNSYIFTVVVTEPDGEMVDMSIVPGPDPMEEHHDNSGEPEESHFDGNAYVLWSCGTGTCYHHFTDIPNFDDGNSTFYKDTTVTADNNTSLYFDVNAEYKGWALERNFDHLVNAYKTKYNVDTVDWTQVDPSKVIGDPPDMRAWEESAINDGSCVRPAEGSPGDVREAFERCVDDYMAEHSEGLPFIKLQPVGEPSDNNAYVSYGDRNFKVVIYNDQFKGVTIGDLSDLNYYPAQWSNPFTRTDQYDISGTSKENPTVIDSILLESTVNIKPLNYNSFDIASMEALDVPADAVTISKVNGEFKLVFSSNFYDNVVFKVTDNKGNPSYLQVKRYTIDGYIRHVDNVPVLTAEFYFDKNKSYTDFALTAKIIYKDGTVKTVPMTAHYGIDDGLGNITDAYEVNEEEGGYGIAGKGLKKSTFEYSLESFQEVDRISKIYINGEYNGSTASNYAGAYVGSGEGVMVPVEGGE